MERGTARPRLRTVAQTEDRAVLLDQLRLHQDDSEPPPGAPVTTKKPLLFVALAGAALALAAGGWYALGSSRAPATPAAVTEPVEAAEPAQPATADGAAADASRLDASGYVVARRQATVSAKVTGRVAEVLIEEGQHVGEGQVIARLDGSNYRASLAQSNAQLAQAIANLDAAQTALTDQEPTYARSRQQYNEGLISAQAFESATASYNHAKSSLNIAHESVKLARAGVTYAQQMLDDTVVRAPFAGVVTVKAAQPGEMVSPLSAGGGFVRTGIGTIVDMDSLEAEVDVSESFISRVQARQPVSIVLNSYPDWQIPGEVIAVIPAADRAKATVRVRIGFRIKDTRILPDMGARVSFLGG